MSQQQKRAIIMWIHLPIVNKLFLLLSRPLIYLIPKLEYVHTKICYYLFMDLHHEIIKELTVYLKHQVFLHQIHMSFVCKIVLKFYINKKIISISTRLVLRRNLFESVDCCRPMFSLGIVVINPQILTDSQPRVNKL